MTSDRRDKGSHRIPIKFTDADDESGLRSTSDDMAEIPTTKAKRFIRREISLTKTSFGADVERTSRRWTRQAELIATRSS
jgi:hypothetical protein